MMTRMDERAMTTSMQPGISKHCINAPGYQAVSGPGEFHPQPLAEPYVSLSTHTAPIKQPVTVLPHPHAPPVAGWRVHLAA